MLFAGLGSIRIVQNCERGLKNVARGRRPWAAFSSPRKCCESLKIRHFYSKLSGRIRGNSLSVFHRNPLNTTPIDKLNLIVMAFFC